MVQQTTSLISALDAYVYRSSCDSEIDAKCSKYVLLNAEIEACASCEDMQMHYGTSFCEFQAIFQMLSVTFSLCYIP